jgi:DNA polymerase III alpha subunit (gram-positive type)
LLKNSQIILNDEYKIDLYTSDADEFTLLKGKLIFNELPAAGDVISIIYEKNDQLLDSVNRIQKD